MWQLLLFGFAPIIIIGTLLAYISDRLGLP